jgi:hypothetical protein
MKDPRMKGVEQGQPGFGKLKRSAMRKSEDRSTRKRRGKKRGGKY